MFCIRGLNDIIIGFKFILFEGWPEGFELFTSSTLLLASHRLINKRKKTKSQVLSQQKKKNDKEICGFKLEQKKENDKLLSNLQLNF